MPTINTYTNVFTLFKNAKFIDVIALNCLWILFITYLISGCSNDATLQHSTYRLSPGKYYAKQYRHSDTIVFHPLTKNSKITGWTELFWTITDDSIYQKDTRGHISFLGLSNSTYKISNDTLTLTFKRDEQKEYIKQPLHDRTRSYKILTSKDTSIILVLLRNKKDYTILKQSEFDFDEDINLR